MHIFVVENHCLKQMVLHQSLSMVFPNQKQIVGKTIPNLVEKMTQKHVLSMLGHCITMTTSFDLSTSKFKHDNKFALVINFVNEQHWEPCYIIVGLFETTNTLGFAMAS